MRNEFSNWAFTGIILLIVILLFTIADYFTHDLESRWSVPEYYFRNKIPAGFFWGIVGLFLARRFGKIWLKSLVTAGVIAIFLQVRYFIEGYALSFVLLFLLIHFAIMYLLSVAMFWILNKYNT